MNDLDPLEQRALAWALSGDDESEEDPGLIVAEAAAHPDVAALDARLAEFARDYHQLKAALSATPRATVEARITALRAEIRGRQAAPIDWSAARADNVRSLAARRRRTLVAGATLVLAIAAALVLLRPTSPPSLDAKTAQALVAELGQPTGAEGFGFGGAVAPGPHERGYLLGVILDLLRARSEAQEAIGSAETELAETLTERVLSGLDAPEEAAARRQRALGGCAAILVSADDRAACERGLADYRARRAALMSGR